MDSLSVTFSEKVLLNLEGTGAGVGSPTSFKLIHFFKVFSCYGKVWYGIIMILGRPLAQRATTKAPS